MFVQKEIFSEFVKRFVAQTRFVHSISVPCVLHTKLQGIVLKKSLWKSLPVYVTVEKLFQLWKKAVVCMGDNYIFCSFVCSVRGPLAFLPYILSKCSTLTSVHNDFCVDWYEAHSKQLILKSPESRLCFVKNDNNYLCLFLKG